MKKLFFFIIVITLLTSSFAQSLLDEYYDISAYLSDIEAGNITSIQKELPKLLKNYPNDPNILLLDALLTNDGEKAVNKFINIFTNYPSSRYADLALYRTYCYYFISEDFENSNIYYNKFKSDYPNSQYFKACKYINLPKKNPNTQINNQSQNVSTTNNKNSNQNSKTYEIQMAAFSMKENAEKLANSLKNQGYTIKLVPKNELTAVILVYQTDNIDKLNAIIEDLSKQYKLSPKILK